jgi:hypothetical protein
MQVNTVRSTQAERRRNIKAMSKIANTAVATGSLSCRGSQKRACAATYINGALVIAIYTARTSLVALSSFLEPIPLPPRSVAELDIVSDVPTICHKWRPNDFKYTFANTDYFFDRFHEFFNLPVLARETF